MKKLKIKMREDCKYETNYRLRNARIRAGLCQNEISHRLGLSYSAYSHYERLRIWPTKKMRTRIAKILGCEIPTIFPPELRRYVSQKKMKR